jgi:hypothetical protein
MQSNLNPYFAAWRGKIESIGDQVLQGNGQSDRIAFDQTVVISVQNHFDIFFQRKWCQFGKFLAH